MKKILLSLFCLLLITKTEAQGMPCWYDSLRIKNFDSTPQLKKDESQFYYNLNRWRQKNSFYLNAKPMTLPCSTCLTVNPSGFKAKYIIPVVVHIIHRPSDPSPGDSSNITNTQVEDQITALNHYYAGLDNHDQRSVNTGIQFCLAQIGPNSNGIYRISSTLSNHNPSIDNMKQLMDLKDTSLSYKNYLHIYIVNEIIDGNGGASGIQGYATFPGTDPQGVVIRYKRFGSTATCSSCKLDSNTLGKVLVHEIGHFLGVQHTFEGGCSGATSTTCADSGDKCCDVPPAKKANTGCSPTPVYSCNPSYDDMIENYMDYTNDLCRSIFTKNQAEIMHFILLSRRSQLVDPKNINKIPLSCESFSARFSGTNTIMCSIQDSVRFTALKYSNVSPKYYWKIIKGSSTIVNDSTNSYKYSWYPPNGYGNYSVMLTVKVGLEIISDTIKDLIQIIDCGKPIQSTQGTWYFGEYAGLKFMQKAVVPNTAAYDADPKTINAGEGCISVCDTLGRLLFYGGAKGFGNSSAVQERNLMELFDKDHNKVTKDVFNFTLHLYSHGSCTQSSIAFPNPSDTSQYYLITNQTAQEFNVFNGLSVFLIEKDNLNNISVTPTNDTFNITSGEGLLAIPSCNNSWWLLFNTSNNKIAVYEFDSYGKHFRYLTESFPMNIQGNLKSSPDGRFVGKDGLLFKFNTSTGLLTKWLNFSDTFYFGSSPYLLQIYGSSFSPNSDFYYYLEDNANADGILWQIDLSKSDPIRNRQNIVKFSGTSFKTLQLGPNGKLYLSMEGETRLAVIENPDSVCSPSNSNACGFNEDGPFTQIGGNGGISQLGLPNMIDTRSPEKIKKEIKIVQRDCDSVILSSSICCASTYEWDFGDLSPKAYTKETSHKYSGNGTYTISLKTNNSITITKQVKVGITHNGINGDKIVCDTANGVTYSSDKNLVHSYEYTWTSNNANVTNLESTPNYATVKWHGNGKLVLKINDLKTGCQSSDSIRIRTKKTILNNIITLYPNQTQCKINMDSIAGSTPTQVGPNFKYGWIIQELKRNPYMIQGENKEHLITPKGSTAYFKRIVYDSGCYHESNKVFVVNTKNEIGGKMSKCGGLVSGSNMSLYGSVNYSWWESTDSFLVDSTIISGATEYSKYFLYSSSPKWVRRKAINGTCTTFSNIFRTDREKVDYEKDLPEKRFICGNGNLAVEIIFDFKTGFEDPKNTSNQYYKIKFGTNDTIAIGNHLHANYFVDGDTVFCVQSIPLCGSFMSRKCIIRKSYNYIHFTTHPASETKAAGTNKSFFAALDNPTGVRWNWQVSSDNSTWYDYDGAPDNDTFIKTNLNRCQNGRYYRVQAITGCGVTNSNAALLTVTGLGSYTQDYWMKDNWQDTGLERNPDSSYIVESSDIWVRNKADGIKPTNLKENQMIAEGDNFIYYTVRNRGVDTAKNGKLYLYWTWAGTGEEWPRKWKYGPNNMFTSPNTGTRHPMGSEINPIAINLPNIKSGDSIRDYIKWDYNIPKPTWFIKDDNLKDSVWPTANICLLARIQTCDEPEFGMSYKEKKNLHYNVIGNNNIATRNCWMRFLNPPKSMDYVRKLNDGTEGKDMGTTVVGSIHDIPTKYKVCISVINSSYLSKANLYLEMSAEFKNAWITGGSHSSGIAHLQDNIFKVTSSSICLDSIYFEPENEGTIRVYASYKDPNDRFASGEIYPISIIQYQYNSLVKIGEVRIEIADNPMPIPVINTSTSLSACQWDMGVTPKAKYIHTDPLPYTIWDNSNSGWITYQPSGIYYLEPASYLIRSVDSINNTIYENSLTIENTPVNPIITIDTVWYNCDYPDSVDYVKSCENGVMYDRFDQVVNESSAGHYTLDPQEPYYTFVCADSTNCTKYSTQIKFMDIIQIPSSTSNNLTGMYNREENPCCFIDLTEAECDGETPLTFGQEIQVYDMNADFLYQTNLELYGGTVLGFRFCPPQWDTASNVINNWYSIVIRNDECSFCRMDFMCDSISDPEPFVILNYPSGKPMDNLGLFEGKSANKGLVTKPVKPQKLPPSISIYPNPTQSEVNVKIVSVNSASITVNITDMAGKSVCKNSYKTTNNQLTTSINLSELVSGIYTVYVPELNYYYKLVIIK